MQHQIIHVPDFGIQLSGRCKAISRSVFSKDIIDIQEAENTLFTAFKTAVVKDLAFDLRTSTPKAMAFSRTVDTGTPSELTDEFRAGVSRFAYDNKYQIVAVLGSQEGNTGGGNIRSVGLYIGSDATTTVGTGTLISLVNSLNVAKTSAIEVTFQYEITFA